jgi:hypothetical protein
VKVENLGPALSDIVSFTQEVQEKAEHYAHSHDVTLLAVAVSLFLTSECSVKVITDFYGILCSDGKPFLRVFSLRHFGRAYNSPTERLLLMSCHSVNPSVSSSVCPSVRMYQHGSHWLDFSDI